jgi:hypothetical protein
MLRIVYLTLIFRIALRAPARCSCLVQCLTLLAANCRRNGRSTSAWPKRVVYGVTAWGRAAWNTSRAWASTPLRQLYMVLDRGVMWHGCSVSRSGQGEWCDMGAVSALYRLGMAIRTRVSDTRRISDLTGMNTGVIFYPWVTSVLDPNRDGYETGIFFYPWVTWWVPDTLLSL